MLVDASLEGTLVKLKVGLIGKLDLQRCVIDLKVLLKQL